MQFVIPINLSVPWPSSIQKQHSLFLRPWHLFIETLESMSSLFFFLIGLKECFRPPWVKQQIRRSRFTENISTNINSFKQNCMMKVKQRALVVNVTVISVRISTALHLDDTHVVCFIYLGYKIGEDAPLRQCAFTKP